LPGQAEDEEEVNGRTTEGDLAAPRIALWDDNPSAIDLLGFDAVVAPVVTAINTPDLDPLTVGIHGPWGGGKSTVLELLAQELASDAVIVVRTNPWEFEDDADVKGTLIGQVIGEFEERFKADEGILEKTADLLKRISWARATLALAKGALTMQWDIDELVKAFTPKSKTKPETMSGFRDAFEKLIESLPAIERVVVLVDDLDRCLPDAVMATLEAIKLFLAVKKMVFVIAADQDMVRDAIAASLGATSRSERFAKRYLDKIVQLPVSLPRLAPYEAEAYIGLLLAQGECEEGQFEALIEKCNSRRRLRQTPLIGDIAELPYKPSEALLRLASQLAQGLGADRITNPREIKRFLNAFGIRRQIAISRGIELSPAVLAKLLLLEDRYRSDFEKLAATPEIDRPTLLRNWETWALEGEGEAPEGISEESKGWAANGPALAAEELGPYITLAASLATVSVAGLIGEELAELMIHVVGESRANRDNAINKLVERPVAEQRLVLNEILEQTRREEDITNTVRGLTGLAKATPELEEEIAEGLETHYYSRFTPAAAVEIAGSTVPALVNLANRLVGDETVEEGVREAARQILAG
jgi:hypothetical protein